MPDDNYRPVPVVRGGDASDFERAQDVLREIHAILAKAGFMLKHQTHATVLCRLIENDQALAIAYVDLISPDVMEVRRCNWANPGRPRPKL